MVPENIHTHLEGRGGEAIHTHPEGGGAWKFSGGEPEKTKSFNLETPHKCKRGMDIFSKNTMYMYVGARQSRTVSLFQRQLIGQSKN